MNIFIITGTSGSGKSVAIRALEDAGFDCIDNLPVQLLESLIRDIQPDQNQSIAIAIDGRQGASIQGLPNIISHLKEEHAVTVLFLDATTAALVNRFSETRRRHPLSSKSNHLSDHSLIESINLERELLTELNRIGHHIDTSHLSPHTLRNWIKELIPGTANGLILLFQSFGFKKGLPEDADIVFDLRCIANPYYEPALRPLNGNDEPVKSFLHQQPDFLAMENDIFQFIEKWLSKYQVESRSYLTVGIGCTGGQHRSVAMVNDLFVRFMQSKGEMAGIHFLKRHRELD